MSASGYRYVPIGTQAATVHKRGLSEATVQGIECGTALGLVPRLKTQTKPAKRLAAWLTCC